MNNNNEVPQIDGFYPEAGQCLLAGEHSQETEVTLEQESNDDTYDWIAVTRCNRCRMPVSETYATGEQIAEHYYTKAEDYRDSLRDDGIAV